MHSVYSQRNCFKVVDIVRTQREKSNNLWTKLGVCGCFSERSYRMCSNNNATILFSMPECIKCRLCILSHARNTITASRCILQVYNSAWFSGIYDSKCSCISHKHSQKVKVQYFLLLPSAAPAVLLQESLSVYLTDCCQHLIRYGKGQACVSLGRLTLFATHNALPALFFPYIGPLGFNLR